MSIAFRAVFNYSPHPCQVHSHVSGNAGLSYFSNCAAMCPVHTDENCVSITETKKRKKPLPTLMLATLLDLSVSTRIATTKTSSMDHLPRCETNL